MKLTLNLSPVRSDEETVASLAGTVLSVNGTDYDLSELPDGATAQHPDLGTVKRNGDEYECAICLGHPFEEWQPKEGATHTMIRASEAMRFPEPIIITTDGEINLPKPELWVMDEDPDVEKLQELVQ